MIDTGFLSDVLIFLLAAALVAVLSQRLKSSPVIGYLIAGILIGPFGLGFITDGDGARELGELGVVFLLFTVGLELPLERLRLIRGPVLLLGLLQILVTGVFCATVALYFGLGFNAAIIIGGALALSSTAVVLQLLSERRELTTQAGRVALAVLLIQDLAVVPLLALVPALAGQDTPPLQEIALAVGKGIAVLVGIAVFGRWVLRPLFRASVLVKSVEGFAAVTLLVLLAAAGATAAVGLSAALGGFLAGILLAETEYRHQVSAEIEPFRGLLLGLFFMTVGMSIDLVSVLANIGPVVAIAVVLVGVKAGILTALCRVFRLPGGLAVRAGLTLSQGGEFGFVLLAPAMVLGVVPQAVGGVLIAAIVLTMAATPALAYAGRTLSRKLTARGTGGMSALEAEAADLREHVIIAGFGRVGQSVAKLLASRDIPFVAVEREPSRIRRAQEDGWPVYYGDASRREVLRALGADRARAAVVILDNADAAGRAVDALRRNFPALTIFVRARDNSHRRQLESLGADIIVHETYELSLRLGGEVLRHAGEGEEDINALLAEYRSDDYALLSDVIFPAAADTGESDAPVGNTDIDDLKPPT